MVERFYKHDGPVFAVSAEIDSGDSFTEPAEFDARRPFNLSVAGDFLATVSLQRSFDDGQNWVDVWTTDEPAERGVHCLEAHLLWRIGCKPGDHAGGLVLVRLSQ